MSAPQLRLSSAGHHTHPAVLDRRIRELVLIALTGLIPVVLALAIVVAIPNPSVADAVVIVAGLACVLGVIALMVSTRYEVTVTMLALYLFLLDGPVKLGLSSGEVGKAVPDILILAVCAGAVMRRVLRNEPMKLPPLSGWILAFVATVALEAFNPKTEGILKDLAGFRQWLQWMPFFFFGYLLVRSKKRLRQFFLIVGACALANAAVATYQTSASPGQLASWGPGYRALFQPTTVGDKAGHGRVYDSGGEARARPVGLGSDSGFSGGIGLLAFPFALALLATWRSRRRWIPIALAVGAMVGVITGLGRLQVIGAILGAIAFVLLAAVGGRRVKRPLGALVTVLAVAIPFAVGFVSIERSGTFSRYETFEKDSAGEVATHKAGAYTKIPSLIARAPFGIGLGTVGAVSGFGGKSTESASSETQYNFVVDELGTPGLVLWVVMSLYIAALTATQLRFVRDEELAILLAGAFAPFSALILMGFSGPLTTSAALGPYFWFAIGIAAYWLRGPGRNALAGDGVAPNHGLAAMGGTPSAIGPRSAGLLTATGASVL